MRPFVRRRRVVDLGAGDEERGVILLALGATSVLAIDKEAPPAYTFPVLGLEPFRGKFHCAQVRDKIRDCNIEVAHLAWPENRHCPGLVELLQELKVVIYVGANTGGTASGTRALFAHFNAREVLAYVPKRDGTLIVYGQRLTGPRALVHREEHPSLFERGIVPFHSTADLFSSTRKLPVRGA